MKKNIIDKFRLDNKVIILTGSAGRIGQRFSHVLSDAGAHVVLVDMQEKSNKKLEKELKSRYNTNPSSFKTDITKKHNVMKLQKLVLKKYKKVDILINNAHYVPRTHPKRDAPFEDYPLELWDETISSNLRGIFLCSQEFGKIMLKQKKGVIVNIASTYGLVGADQRIYGKSGLNLPVSYAASKGAIINLTRYLAAYWHGKNIRVNTLSPGGVADTTYQEKSFIKKYSERTILGRMAKKDEYNGAMLFLISDASSYMTGANLVVDGGWTAW